MPPSKATPGAGKPIAPKSKSKQTPSKSHTKKTARKSKTTPKVKRTAATKSGKAPATPKNGGFPILGLGASAGGLEAFLQFFDAMPPKAGMAFLVVVHLDPDHVSILPALIQKHTEMSVEAAEDQTELRPNRIYVAPPNKDLALMKGKILLLDPEAPRGHRLPIDFFFRQLAQDQGENAACIIFSGTGSDGSVGLRDIKGAGGLVVAQEPSSAKYDGMPASALATGMVDLVLPPNQMPDKLIYYFSHHRKLATGDEASAKENGLSEEPVAKILVLLRDRVGHDFSFYKQSTIIRRIERRMSIQQIPQHGKYLRFVRANPEELDALFRDFLIGVTSFFRDPEAFEYIKGHVIPKLLEQLKPQQSLRVWVPGCSTGEEVYSLVIILKECLAEAGKDLVLQVFGTDIDEVAVEKAREGLFPASIANDVSPQRLQRFFNEEHGAYRVKKELREPVVFSVQDVTKDPPFSKLDLLCCRNLLIYLNSPAQKKLIPLFHYTLKPQGVLFLGTSESTGEFADLFKTLNKKWKIYTPKPSALAAKKFYNFPTGPLSQEKAEGQAAQAPPGAAVVDLALESQKIILSDFSPAAVIVDQKGEVQYIHGHTGKFLEPATGRASHKILAMAREGLRLELSTAMRKAQSSGKEVRSFGVRVKSDGGHQYVDLAVRPIKKPEAMKGLLAVILGEAKEPPARSTAQAGQGPGPDGEEGLAVMEQELQDVRQRHQAVIEELETSNEELKSMNEELQSANEELQSTNEELEATKEEQQSLNEELVTVNAELQAKVDELAQTQDDMQNLLASTEIATIFLGNDLTVRRFTPEAANLINLIAGDVGRPLQHLATNLDYPELVDEAKKVLNKLVIKQAEVQTKDGAWFQMRILPYRTMANVIDGVVITFTDIEDQMKAKKMLLELNNALKESGTQQSRLLVARDSELADAKSSLAEQDKEIDAIRKAMKDLEKK
jgi:two-component system CheB/CheR fusion protein